MHFVRAGTTLISTLAAPSNAAALNEFLTNRGTKRHRFVALTLAQVAALWHPHHAHLRSALHTPLELPHKGWLGRRAVVHHTEERQPPHEANTVSRHDPVEMTNAEEGNQVHRELALAELLERDGILLRDAVIRGNSHLLQVRAALSPYNAWACIHIELKQAHRFIVRYINLAMIIKTVPLPSGLVDSTTRDAIDQCPSPEEVHATFFALIAELMAALGGHMVVALPAW